MDTNCLMKCLNEKIILSAQFNYYLFISSKAYVKVASKPHITSNKSVVSDANKPSCLLCIVLEN